MIGAANTSGLVNIGGQLQFRLAGGATCECYEVEVNTSTMLENWHRSMWVDLSAKEALRQLQVLQDQFDFIAQGRTAFGEYFDEFGVTDADLLNAMCFAWYVAKP